MTQVEIKQALVDQSFEMIESKMKLVQQVIEEYQTEANEHKSSGEDKFDSAKEDYQNKKEAHKKQLAQLFSMKLLIAKIKMEINSVIMIGTIIETSEMNYFVSATFSDHPIEIEGKRYTPISYNSPICVFLRSLTLGESGEFRGREIRLNHLF